MKMICRRGRATAPIAICCRWLLLLAGLMVLLSACVTPSGGGRSAPRDPASPLVFRSEDYVVHQLAGTETPEMLAQAYLGDAAKAGGLGNRITDIADNFKDLFPAIGL